MLNPVQGVKNFANNHPKATKVAKVAVGAGVVAGAALATSYVAYKHGVPEAARQVLNENNATKIDKFKKGFEVIGQKLAEIPAKVASVLPKIGKNQTQA